MRAKKASSDPIFMLSQVPTFPPVRRCHFTNSKQQDICNFKELKRHVADIYSIHRPWYFELGFNESVQIFSSCEFRKLKRRFLAVGDFLISIVDVALSAVLYPKGP